MNGPLAPCPTAQARQATPVAGGVAPVLALASASAWLLVVAVDGWPLAVAAAVLASGAAVAMRRGERDAAALAWATAALAAFYALRLGVMLTWPLLAVVAGVIAASRLRAPWLARGDTSAAIVAWIVAAALASGVALVAWWAILRPDLSGLALPPWVRPLPPVAIAGLFLLWSSLNAIAEEFFFRGVMQHALARAFGRAGIVIQALPFGLAHLHGVPGGAAGVLLATIYGLMMGALRQRARGLLAPCIAHVVADVVIVVIVYVVSR